jgi:AhpD family alkylhydroperoxidase
MSFYSGRIYTFKQYKEDVVYILKNIPQLHKAFNNKNISKSFAEKIMLVTTAVNGCRYCAWFHAKQALASGMKEDEIKDILNLQFHTDTSGDEIPALLYAQNYAETNRNPDSEISQKLFEYYGNGTANDILLRIRLIYFANLSGNTFDAFLSRIRGVKAENSSGFFEFIFFLLNFPVFFPLSFFTEKNSLHR